MDVLVRRLRPDDWTAFRDIRLTSLADAPQAFGSTLALEEGLPEAEWRRRLEPANGVTVIACRGGNAVGIMGGYALPDGGTAMLIGAWVRPDARGTGVSDALAGEVIAWAREHGFERIVLRVADGNDASRGLFLRQGFTPTGERTPLESDPAVGTELLVRALS
jgi:RimJ/RimL family protein N-acetyltransferase